MARRGLGYNRGDFTSCLYAAADDVFHAPPPPLYWDSRNRTNKRAAIAVVAVTLTATAFSAQAQTINICDRTQQVQDAILNHPSVKADSCTGVSESEMASIVIFDPFALPDAGITSLQSEDFNGLTSLLLLNLGNNQLRTLPNGIFSGLTGMTTLTLIGNPVFFRFTVRFEPAVLDESFTTASVKLVLREGAPRSITVFLGVIGATLSGDSLTIARGGTESAAVTVTREDGGEYFLLTQRSLELGGFDDNHDGYKIVRGPSIVIGGLTVRIKVFLEGALE